MAQVDIYIGTYGYLAYLWADNLKKFVKVAMPSVDIEYLDKQIGHCSYSEISCQQ